MFRNNRITGPLVIVALTALLALSGSDCAVVVKSGSSSDDKDREDPTVVIGIASGTLVDAPVEGVQYESGSIRGVTAADGGFRYETGARVRFHIGDIPLGQPVAGKSVVTPVDLVAGEGLDSPAVINLGRLLQSLDAVPGDDRITIPAVVRDRALATNPALTGVIEHLDYADETRFVNAASQLLAVLTDGYPHTVVLVDASQARLHLERALSRAGVPVGNR